MMGGMQMDNIDKRKVYLYGILLITLYFSSKMLWDSFTILFELISLFIIGAFALIEIRNIFIRGKNEQKVLLFLWIVYIIYVILNGLLNDFNISCFIRSLYEYCFYSCILWFAILFSNYIDLKIVIKWLSYIGIILALLSFCEFIFKFHFIEGMFSNYLTYDNIEVVRAKVFTRSYLSHGVLLGIFSICNAYSYKISRNRVFAIGAALCFFSILATGSRGPLVATFIAYGVFIILENKKKIKKNISQLFTIKLKRKYYIILIVLLIFIILIIFNISTGIYFIDYSIVRIRSIFNWTGDAGNLGRLKIWEESLNIIKDNFIFGIGASKTGSWGSASLMVTESDYLKKLIEIGIVGTIIYYSIPIYVIYKFFKSENKDSSNTLISIIILILVDSVILQVTEEIMIAFFYWLSLGFLFSNLQRKGKMNILYYSNVDWYWIKQRPHFIAEGLARTYNVKFVYQHRYNRSIMQKSREQSIVKKVYPIYVIPKGDRVKILYKINNIIRRLYISLYISIWDIDTIILTYPTQINSIPNCFTVRILYDCMDNYIEFITDKNEKQELALVENILINKADLITVSSEKLIEELKIRHQNLPSEKCFLVRNAYAGEIINNTHTVKVNSIYKLCYYGTISSWFDFDLLKKSLDKYRNIEYFIYGPVEPGIEMPTNLERFNYMGIAEHSRLSEIVESMDCLIMPFVVNELIESVDPVKLYEYINFNKNIISVYYNEINRFKPYVYFYKNESEYYAILDSLLKNNLIKYSNDERIDFLEKNNWDSRIQQYVSLLEQSEREEL